MSSRIGASLALLLLLGVAAQGCARIRDPGAAPARAAMQAPEAEVLRRLAIVFYTRLTNRRVDSIATFKDPALREFFQSPDAFADYYADLVQDLTENNFEAMRPTRIQLIGLEREAMGQVRLRLRFTGENGLPLRFWRTSIVRDDQWRRMGGRWWIIPGKV